MLIFLRLDSKLETRRTEKVLGYEGCTVPTESRDQSTGCGGPGSPSGAVALVSTRFVYLCPG